MFSSQPASAPACVKEHAFAITTATLIAFVGACAGIAYAVGAFNQPTAASAPPIGCSLSQQCHWNNSVAAISTAFVNHFTTGFNASNCSRVISDTTIIAKRFFDSTPAFAICADVLPFMNYSNINALTAVMMMYCLYVIQCPNITTIVNSTINFYNAARDALTVTLPKIDKITSTNLQGLNATITGAAMSNYTAWINSLTEKVVQKTSIPLPMSTQPTSSSTTLQVSTTAMPTTAMPTTVFPTTATTTTTLSTTTTAITTTVIPTTTQPTPSPCDWPSQTCYYGDTGARITPIGPDLTVTSGGKTFKFESAVIAEHKIFFNIVGNCGIGPLTAKFVKNTDGSCTITMLNSFTQALCADKTNQNFLTFTVFNIASTATCAEFATLFAIQPCKITDSTCCYYDPDGGVWTTYGGSLPTAQSTSMKVEEASVCKDKFNVFRDCGGSTDQLSYQSDNTAGSCTVTVIPQGFYNTPACSNANDFSQYIFRGLPALCTDLSIQLSNFKYAVWPFLIIYQLGICDTTKYQFSDVAAFGLEVCTEGSLDWFKALRSPILKDDFIARFGSAELGLKTMCFAAANTIALEIGKNHIIDLSNIKYNSASFSCSDPDNAGKTHTKTYGELAYIIFKTISNQNGQSLSNLPDPVAILNSLDTIVQFYYVVGVTQQAEIQAIVQQVKSMFYTVLGVTQCHPF